MSGFDVTADFDALYCGYYLQGLMAVLGRSPRYVASPVPHRRDVLLATIDGRKVVIDTADHSAVDPEAFGWSDWYGKINAADPDVVAIGPGFGVRWASPARAVLHLIKSTSADRRLARDREHLAGFVRQYRYRLPLADLSPGRSDAEYVFFSSSIWKREHETNELRRRFILAARACGSVTAEVGFAPRTADDVAGYVEVTTSRVPYRTYVTNMKRSVVAFNTPAVMGCHGWKLGEFLAMGKAIISTPLTRRLPSPLVHGEHLHIVDGSRESIEDALTLLVADRGYRSHLETNARGYFDRFVCPRAVAGTAVAGRRSWCGP